MKNTFTFLIIFTAFIGSNSFAIEIEPAKEFKGCTATEQCCSYSVGQVTEYICRTRCGHGENLELREACKDLVRPVAKPKLVPLDTPNGELF